MLRIHLLGHLRCFDDARPLKVSGLPRTIPLWAYLLIHRQTPLPRNRLAYSLWPDYSESDPHANLRRHLHDLRRLLPAEDANTVWILADANTIQWNPAAPFWLDVDESIRDTELASTGAITNAATNAAKDAKAVEAAIALYTGDLLADHYDDWLFFERERLHEQFFAALTWLIQHHQSQGTLAQAIVMAQQLLQHDPIREETVRALMRLRLETGDRTGARQEYRRFEQRLRAERR